MDTSPAKSATVLWARLRLSLVKYRKGRFRRLVESVKHVRNFAEKFSISDFGTAAAIVSAAEIRLGEDRGLDSYFDQSAKFAEWLRSINNPDNDELCIRFLVKVSTTYSSFVSTFPRLPPPPSFGLVFDSNPSFLPFFQPLSRPAPGFERSWQLQRISRKTRSDASA